MTTIVLLTFGAGILLVAGILAGMLAFGTAGKPEEMESVTRAAQSIDRSEIPALSHYASRNGATLAYRAYPGATQHIAVLIHGSVEGSTVMHASPRSCKPTA